MRDRNVWRTNASVGLYLGHREAASAPVAHSWHLPGVAHLFGTFHGCTCGLDAMVGAFGHLRPLRVQPGRKPKRGRKKDNQRNGRG
jgi:hypothetical protein